MAVDVALSWDLSPTTADKVDGQRVYRSSASSPSFPTDYTQLAEVGDAQTTYADTGVAEDQSLTYAVTAFNAAGESTPTTNSIDTSVAPSTPQNLTFTDTTTEDELSFAWDPVDWGDDQDSYQIYRAEASGSTRSDYSQVGTVAAGTPSYTDTGLEDGERFFYRVGATNSVGDSDLSNEIDAVTILPVPTIGEPSIDSDGNVVLPWANNDDSPDGGIDVERSPLPTGATTQSEIHGKSIAIQQDGYGTWVCVENYEHYGGTNPAVGPEDTFPQLGDGLTTASEIEASEANGELRHVDNIDQYGGWEVDAVRLEATTTNHSRKIHFFTTDQSVIDATFTEQSDETDYTDFQGSSTTLYDDHTANLPAAAGNGDADTRSDRLFGSGFPFYNGGTYHWAVKGTGNRWEVDDYPDDNGSGYQHSTVHRVWVRVTGDTESTVLANAFETVASGLATSTTEYTDTTVSSGETYEYRIERNTDHATATSAASNTVTTPAILTRSTTITANSSVASSRTGIAKVRDTTVTGDSQITTTRDLVKERTTVLTGDSQITTARDVSKLRQTTVTADGQITARAEFAEAFADERTDSLSWDFSYDPFGFVSEWITETEELTETEAFTIVVDSVVSDFYEVGVEYDLDGDGEAEHRTDTQTVTSDGQTLVFPTVGEPGQYRIYIQQMRPDDFLRELTVGLTRY